MLCPPLYAFILHQRLPDSELIITELSGHSITEKTIEKELLKVMKKLENISDQKCDWKKASVQHAIKNTGRKVLYLNNIPTNKQYGNLIVGSF